MSVDDAEKAFEKGKALTRGIALDMKEFYPQDSDKADFINIGLSIACFTLMGCDKDSMMMKPITEEFYKLFLKLTGVSDGKEKS